jgi:ribose transport system ATP-binding protein
LRGVDLAVSRGEIHGLVGANGAGKSTLVRILAGVVHPDAGTIRLEGLPVLIHDAQHAMRLGLAFIHQELNLVPKFSGLQNLVLGTPKARRLGFVDWAGARRSVEPVVEQMGIHFSLDLPAESLTVAEQWLLSIARALTLKSRLIAMDEPTASLSTEEVEHLFSVIRELSSQGIAVIYVTHRLHEIEAICQRVTVFKDGERVALLEREQIDRETLVKAIVGDVARPGQGDAAGSGAGDADRPVLEVRGVRYKQRVCGVSLELRAGEVVGLGGLAGAGRTELVRTIFGAERMDAGEMLVDGVAARVRGPHDAVRLGIAFVPEERRTQGLMLSKSIVLNMNVTDLRAIRSVAWLPFVNLRAARDRAVQMVRRLAIKASGVRASVSTLSGGNQQKVVIGKWLVRTPKVLILDEPTRGVDIGARMEIYQIIRSLAGSGTAILVVSSDVEELVKVAGRVIVMVEGVVAGELKGPEVTEENILRLCYAHGRAGTPGVAAVGGAG